MEKEKIDIDYIVPAEKYAAVYARKSTLQESFSLRTQAELAKEKIRENDLVLYDIYEDEESATRFSPFHREGFKRLLCDAKNGHFKTIVVFRRDRLARKVEDLLEIRKIFRKLGIRVIYSSNGEFQPEQDNYISNFIESIIISVAELEPSVLAQRVKAGKEKKREGNLYDAAIPPFGLKKVSTDKKSMYIKDIDENDDNAKIISEIYNMFLYPQEYEELNQIPDRPKYKNQLLSKIALYISNKYSSQFKKKKTSTDITKYILNPVYAGLMTKDANVSTLKLLYQNNLEINKEEFIVAKNVEPIIEPQEWFKSLVKFIREYEHNEPMKSDTVIYFFKNMLFCKVCKCKVILLEETYQCKNKCTFLQKDKLELSLLRKVVIGLLNHNYLMDYYKDITDETKKNLEEIEEIIGGIQGDQQKEINDILNKYEIDVKPDFEMLAKLIEDEKKQKQDENLNLMKEDLIQKMLTKDMLENMVNSETISSAVLHLKKNVEYTHDLIKDVIHRIYISGKNMEEFYDNCQEIKYKNH